MMSDQRRTGFMMGSAIQVPTHLEDVGCIAQVAKVQQMSAMRSRLERDFLEGLPGKSVLQLREHLTTKLAELREQAAHVMSDPPPEQVWLPSHANAMSSCHRAWAVLYSAYCRSSSCASPGCPALSQWQARLHWYDLNLKDGWAIN